MVRWGLILVLMAMSWGCGDGSATLDSIQLREVTLPAGQKVFAEVMMRQDDMARGMMHRPQLPADRALLFIFAKPGKYTFWMLNVQVPLDIVWMDRNRVITEIVRNAEPCPEKPCRSYGTSEQSQFVLEFAGGAADKYGLAPGQAIGF